MLMRTAMAYRDARTVDTLLKHGVKPTFTKFAIVYPHLDPKRKRQVQKLADVLKKHGKSVPKLSSTKLKQSLRWARLKRSGTRSGSTRKRSARRSGSTRKRSARRSGSTRKRSARRSGSTRKRSGSTRKRSARRSVSTRKQVNEVEVHVNEVEVHVNEVEVHVNEVRDEV
ncbi:MAG: hypothetical protein EBU90_10220 [Proteobacteria bacterium]|nr:hypothetical protein [Pseudomonadota bacterium]